VEWERAETLARVEGEVQQLGGDAQEVEAAAGEYPPCIETPVDHYFSVEHPRNDTVLGEYDPPRPLPDPPPHTHAEPFVNDVTSGEYHPPPPIRNKARTSQANPIGIHSDEHDEEHDERALTLIITDAVEPSNDGLRGAAAAAAAIATTAAGTVTVMVAATTTAAAPPPRTPPNESPDDDTILGRTTPSISTPI
jgi:hypothetical protein